MNARNWTMASALPVLILAVSGFSSAAVAEGAKECRQYVPGAGVTISVECSQPVASVVLASAPLKCRRYIPGAGMAIEEACPEDAAPGTDKAVRATEAPASGPRTPQKVPPVAVTPGGATGNAAKPEKIERAAAVIDTGKSETITCSGALDRAQLGSETDRDLNALRSGCTSGG
jgi:hypothetical protein